jgi:hypothetical protein
MSGIFILLAGVVLGIWHSKTVRVAEHKAFRAGQAYARNRAKVYRVQDCREAIPVPGYAEARWMDHGVEHRKIVSINEIANKALAEGRAVGRVQ